MAGISYNVVILSSSPPLPGSLGSGSPRNGSPTGSAKRVTMSASPPRARSPLVNSQGPCLDASGAGAGGLTGSLGTARAFATVSSLVQSEYFAPAPFESEQSIPSAQPPRTASKARPRQTDAAKKPRKRAAKVATTEEDPAKPKPRPRGRKPKADTISITEDAELRAPPAVQSPFFSEDAGVPALEAPSEPSTTAPKLTKSGKPRKSRAKKLPVENGSLGLKIAKPRSTKSTKGVKEGQGKAQAADGVDAPVENIKAGVCPRASLLGDADTIVEGSHVSNAERTSCREPSNAALPKKTAPRKKRNNAVDEGLHLDEAVSRRRDWTPPRESNAAGPFTDSAGKENTQIDLGTGSNAFTAIINNFAYAQSPTKPAQNAAAAPVTDAMGLTKRRRVELVDVPANRINSRDSSPEKGKAPKKKARTITDLVTGQYAPRDSNAHPDSVTSDFFHSRTITTKVPLKDAATPQAGDPPKKPARKRSTSRSESEKADTKPKGRSRKTTAKAAAKPKLVAEKLLSPSSALKLVNGQNVLFGTASQLVLEESPRTVRQIQLAIKESEQEASASVMEVTSPIVRCPRLSAMKGKRSLWNASTRDDEGGLLQHDDLYLPAPDRTCDINLLIDDTADALSEPSTFIDIDSIPPPPAILISSNPPTPSETTRLTSQVAPSNSATEITQDDSFDDIDDFFRDLPPSNQYQESQGTFADIDDFQAPPSTRSHSKSPNRTRPPLSVPVHKRSMQHSDDIAKPRTVKAATKLNSTCSPPKSKPKSGLSPAPTTPPKLPPRFIDIEEILDSDDEVLEALSPTPPRIRRLEDMPPLPLVSMSTGKPPLHIKSPTKETDLVPVFRVLSTDLVWTGIKPTVFVAISAHIRTLPPTTNPSRPSWHERILLYDPIPLEEFTSYLNAKTSIRSYKRATQKQTKAWNKHLKGMGQETMAVEEGDGDVLAVKKEIEAYMVQEWCQEHSICCIWAEGRGKGGARKGYY